MLSIQGIASLPIAGTPAAAAAPPPDQIYAYCGDEGESVDYVEDWAPFEWYCDHSIPLRADVPDAIQAFDFSIDEQFIVEDVYPDYYAQPPPDVWEPLEPSLVTEEPPEPEDFGFSISPQPPDVWEPPEPSLVIEEPPEDEDFGFYDVPLSGDLSSVAIIAESLEQEEQVTDEDYGFYDVPLPDDVIPPPPPVPTGFSVPSWGGGGSGYKDDFNYFKRIEERVKSGIPLEEAMHEAVVAEVPRTIPAPAPMVRANYEPIYAHLVLLVKEFERIKDDHRALELRRVHALIQEREREEQDEADLLTLFSGIL